MWVEWAPKNEYTTGQPATQACRQAEEGACRQAEQGAGRASVRNQTCVSLWCPRPIERRSSGVGRGVEECEERAQRQWYHSVAWTFDVEFSSQDLAVKASHELGGA